MEIDSTLPGKHVQVALAPQDICALTVRQTLHAQGIVANEAECAGIAKFLRRVAPPHVADLSLAATMTADDGQVTRQPLPPRASQ